MFLKIATVIAIVGVALSVLLSLIQQVMFMARFYGDGYLMLSRLISITDLFLLNGSLLIFFVAFLLSLRAK
ncbi:MAG: hypothetical protein ACR2HX_02660 [Pyrinomonadaceae bacterium]